MGYRGVLALGVAALWCGIVSAQTAPPTGAPQRSGEPKRQNVPPTISNNNTAEQAAALMRANGGSLLQAQMAVQPNPAQMSAEKSSFLAVPEPTPRNLKRHDLVSILVNEQSEITSKGTSNLTRDSQIDAKVNNFIKFKPSDLAIMGLQTTTTPEINLSGNRTFQGQGDVERSDSFTARITAEVVDVKPNGTVVLQARKRIKTDDEQQQFILTGTCRAEDINAAGTVLSSQLYDLELQKNHTGDVRNATKRGLVGKLLDLINPF